MNGGGGDEECDEIKEKSERRWGSVKLKGVV